MRELMESECVEECVMESTSIYWMPIWRVLENTIKLHLVNPYFIKQLPGKKNDIKDTEWIATCLPNNLITSSFVPDEKIQRLRQYDQRIFDLNTEISRKLVKIDQCVQRCNIRINNDISTTDSKGYHSVVRLLAEGVTDANVLVTKSPKQVQTCRISRSRNEESTRKIKSRRITHGNKFLRKTLIKYSYAASKTKDSFFAGFSYRQCVERRKNRHPVEF